MVAQKTKARWDRVPKQPVRQYDKGERRFKHVGTSSQPEIQFTPDEPKRWIGKCPNTLLTADHARLLNEAISGDQGDREIGFVKHLYAVNDGAIYRGDTTDRGKSYHGYPYRGRLTKGLLDRLRTMAVAKNCERKFDDWVDRHITVHGS
ncbi:MAG: hypothetical protein ACREHE_15790 [Rhizomicrobium sp.]